MTISNSSLNSHVFWDILYQTTARYHLEIINRILKLYSTNLLYLTISSISIKQNVCNFTMGVRGSKDNRSKFEPGFPKVYEHL